MNALFRTYPSTLSISQLLIRIVLGITFIAHGAPKFLDGFAGTAEWFGALGIPLPGFFAIFIAILELVGGIGLILGLGTRIVALFHFFDMLVAMFVVHIVNGFFVDNGGYELVLILGIASLSLMISGAGEFSLDNYLLKRQAAPVQETPALRKQKVMG